MAFNRLTYHLGLLLRKSNNPFTRDLCVLSRSTDGDEALEPEKW